MPIDLLGCNVVEGTVDRFLERRNRGLSVGPRDDGVRKRHDFGEEDSDVDRRGKLSSRRRA